MKLFNLSKIFDQRILRIPDYQRGYAWQERQLADFWDDICRLKDDKKLHYTGVITLEEVPKKIWNRWDEDTWLINDMGYTPFYVVDGQQRLITSMILLQCILEAHPEEEPLNNMSIEEARKRYILLEDMKGVKQSFLFGYEKDDPSYEALKVEIFGTPSHKYEHKETLYTRNLVGAKKFFEKQIKSGKEDISDIFKKLTLKMRYNLYEIDDEMDVFVAFETMNNRGKSLTNLELLKNRLIYLSSLLDEKSGSEELRDKINTAWKTIYGYLGKNPKAPLDDDDFLENHWMMYFQYTRGEARAYVKFLLDEQFTAQNFTNLINEENGLAFDTIADYVTSLQESVKVWFYIHNPSYPEVPYGRTVTDFLDKLNRLRFGAFRPLLLAAFVTKQENDDISKFLKAIERYNFVIFTVSRRRANTGDFEFYRFANSLHENESNVYDVIGAIDARIEYYYDPEEFLKYITEKYKFGDQNGFYDWGGLLYFLYEHEQYLLERGLVSIEKLNWKSLNTTRKNYVTVEHILPQNDGDDYWQNLYKDFSDDEKEKLTHSLGNLLPLSRAKNSALQNKGFKHKKDNNEGVGYYNGSASENEVSKADDWKAQNIYDRGMELLEFMEKRWGVKLEYSEPTDKNFKEDLLHLNFSLSGDKSENSTEQNSD